MQNRKIFSLQLTIIQKLIIFTILTVLNIVNKLHSTVRKFNVARMRNKSNINSIQVGFFLSPFSRGVKVGKF